ncbi:MAG: L-glyceraldehyde 3-phosphate reductase [Ruminococcaceae bacterium]|jgi:L-glyceraldehyde 3-phosphate reductase|nr:L-glyceraldehyde 3-phosphate reductase [Oscillospiraceae bacterium]
MYNPNEYRYEGKEYFACGKSGLKISPISLGMWHNFGSSDNFENMREMIFTAFDNGITHFDLANNYGPIPGSAEEHFGKIINQNLAAYRNELVISTKAGYRMWDGPYGDGGSRKYLLTSLDDSLKRLKLDYVDIFYHHRMDKTVPVEESMLALADAVRSGKALYAGISNYDAETTAKAAEILNELKCPYVLNQIRLSIFNRTMEDNGALASSYEHGFGVICFSPLAQGMLSDKYLHGIPADSRAAGRSSFLNPEDLTPERLEQIRKLNEIALNRGQMLSQMALSWLLNKKEVTSVLVGASNPEQIKENIGAVSNVSFTEDELKLIDSISREYAFK